jgi:sugar O-acyltransferase (sialic acid O-acetyltransferase NeuD family)
MREISALRHLLIIGAGGSGREVAWLARDVHGDTLEMTFAVEPEYLIADTIEDIPVVAMDAMPPDATHFVVAIGDLVERRRIAIKCEACGLSPATLVHPGVPHSERVVVGAGSIICAGTILTTNVRIGRHVHINIGCTISHDVTLGDFTTLSPGVHLSGHVHAEEDVFFGTGANVINGIAGRPLVLGRGAVVAAGACVTKPVEAGAMVAGVPAIRKR